LVTEFIEGGIIHYWHRRGHRGYVRITVFRWRIGLIIFHRFSIWSVVYFVWLYSCGIAWTPLLSIIRDHVEMAAGFLQAYNSVTNQRTEEGSRVAPDRGP
jgi:hypothetical protein